MKQNLSILLVLLTVIFFIFFGFGCATNGEDEIIEEVEVDDESEPDIVEPITINAVTAWQPDEYGGVYFEYVGLVEEVSGGNIVFNLMGGPEVIPSNELNEAVRDGAVDFAWTSPAYQTDEVPESFVLEITPQSWTERRESSAFDYFNQIQMEEMNSIVIGGAGHGLQYTIYSTERVTTTDDFQGLRLRGSPAYVAFVEDGLGGEVLMIPGSEIYSAVERGIVDGFLRPSVGLLPLNLQEVINYKIEPYFWEVSFFFLMNLDAWNDLPGWAQDDLTEAAIIWESEKSEPFWAAIAEEEDKILQEEYNVEIITVEDADKYIELSLMAGWDYLRRLVGEGEEVEELISVFE